MSQNQILLIVIGICLFIFVVSLFVHQKEIIFRWIIRGVAGGVFIFIANIIFNFLNIGSPIGVNLLTIFTCSMLGAPGIIVLYIVGFYQMLS
jgi:cytochrome c oxidase assembly factor CtaG